MKTRIAALLACMALSAPLAAQQFDTISFGVDGGYPPFDVLAPSGEITGFDIDIANALCTQLKAKCVFVKQPFESMIAALNAHKFDAIIASLNITDERKKEVDFTDRYYRSAAQLVARKGARCCRRPPALRARPSAYKPAQRMKLCQKPTGPVTA
jgi:histidine transport system substrate-binding protein